MNWAERLHRLALELLLFYMLLEGLAAIGMAVDMIWIAAFLVAHTMNALFNGQAVALWRHVYGSATSDRAKEKFVRYFDSLQERINKAPPAGVAAICVMGSIVRGELRPTSDVDMAVIAKPGILNILLALNYLVLERAKAFLAGFPLDAYVYRNWRELEAKMRVNEEPPMFLYCADPALQDKGSHMTARKMREHIVLTESKPKAPRVILVGAGGGHLTEALLAVEGLRIKRTIATFCLPHTRSSLEGEVVYCLIDPHGSLPKYIKNFFQSLWMILRVRPHAVLSSGGGMSISACLIGKLVGAKVIYVESGARVDTLSKTGELLYRFADIFIVQWRPLAERYPKAIYGGVLL